MENYQIALIVAVVLLVIVVMARWYLVPRSGFYMGSASFLKRGGLVRFMIYLGARDVQIDTTETGEAVLLAENESGIIINEPTRYTIDWTNDTFLDDRYCSTITFPDLKVDFFPKKQKCYFDLWTGELSLEHDSVHQFHGYYDNQLSGVVRH